MRLKFYKMSGAGNDFVLLSGRAFTSAALKTMAVKLCDRKAGIGADGLLYVNPALLRQGRRSSGVNKAGAGAVSLRYFNSDGSEAFCGNGSRCAAWWAYSTGLVNPASALGGCGVKGENFALKTIKGVLAVKVTGREKIKMRMPAVPVVHLNYKCGCPEPVNPALSLRSLCRRGILRKCGARTVHFLNTGVPHAVVPLKNIAAIDVDKLGRLLRFHKAFGPAGTNVDFVELKKGRIHIRTYERGVEAETLACGTGITAGAIALGLAHGLAVPVHVTAKSGERFKVWFKAGTHGSVDDIYIEGPAKTVFEGTIIL